MTTQTFTIDGRTINALNTHAPKKDVRYYLNGLHIKGDGDTLIIEATDGHRLAQYRPDIEHELNPFEVIVSVPKLPAAKVLEVAVETSDAGDTTAVTFSTSDATYTGAVVHGTYPDTQRVIPTEVTGEAASVNPNYMADAAKLFAEIGKAKGMKRAPAMRLRTNGALNAGRPGASLFTSSNIPGLLVIIMPLDDPEAEEAEKDAAAKVNRETAAA